MTRARLRLAAHILAFAAFLGLFQMGANLLSPPPVADGAWWYPVGEQVVASLFTSVFWLALAPWKLLKKGS
jgi:hypothetical protein